MTEEIFDPLADAVDDITDIDDEENVVIEITDDETGEKFYFEQEQILEVDGNRYALLVEIPVDDDECGCGCEHDHDDDDVLNARFAKIVTNSDGEDEYIEPTDEEFEAAVKAYDALWDEEDEE